MGQSPRVLIDIWNDYLCAFCYLNLPALDQVRKQWGERIIMRWHAYELYPEETGVRHDASIAAQREWRLVQAAAKAQGLALNRPASSLRSRLALEAAEVAKDFGLFTEMNHALFESVYRRGEDIGSKDVLQAVADRIGLGAKNLEKALLDPEYALRIDQDYELAQALGVEGIPTLVVRQPKETLAQGLWLSGVITYVELSRVVEELLGEEAA